MPALSIIAMVVVLLAVTGISTYRNLDMTEKRVAEDIRHQAAMMLRALEAGTRSSMAMPMWRMDALSRLLHETARDNDISTLYLVDSAGTVLHHSDPLMEGLPAPWVPETIDPPDFPYDMVRDTEGRQVFYMAKRFAPEMQGIRATHGHMMTGHHNNEAILVVGLSMEGYEKARQADIRHALFMGVIMTALGVGALFFLFVIQNYYLVGRSLRQTRDDTQQVIRNMADGLVSVDRQGRLLFLNPQAIRLLGLKNPRQPGADISRHLSFEDVGIQAALESGETTLHREILVENTPGELTPLSFNVTPLREDDGTVRGAVALIRDLTEIKTLEKQIRRAETLAAVGELAASVAHEIRNPLGSIRTGLQFLMRRMDSAQPEMAYGQLIISEVDRINRVVSDLLTYSRPGEPIRRPEDLVPLCHHSLQLVRADAATQGVSLQFHTDLDSPVADVDRHQLIQVLLNLLLNAMAAVQEGGHIDMILSRMDSDHWVEIAVIDDGQGIPESALDKLFEPFFTTREQGTGLGLAIAKKIVDGHGGRIRAESPPPGRSDGTVFRVQLPAAAPGRKEHAP